MLTRHLSLIALMAGFLGLAVLPACNTFQGAGEDIESAGQAITETAEDAEEEIND